MKLRALSHYGTDVNTRYGDCIMVYDDSALIVYDCGHSQHKDEITAFLILNASISDVHLVVSHNDSDHTDGINDLIRWLGRRGKKYEVSVYTHQYLKHVDAILDKIDDGRRTRESLKEALLEEFDNIRGIIETAEAYGFSAVEALKNVSVAECTIVGPTETEFIKVAATAVDNRAGSTIDGETVMNAASVQLKCELDSGGTVLLCGDASLDYLRSLDGYSVIQLPHHGQLGDAEVIFDKLPNAGTKVFLVSDNTGTGATSGGSDDLMKSAAAKGKQIKNTRKGVVDLPDESRYDGGGTTTKSGIYVPSTQKTGGYGV